MAQTDKSARKPLGSSVRVRKEAFVSEKKVFSWKKCVFLPPFVSSLVLFCCAFLSFDPFAPGQVATVDNTTSTPIFGSGHDYIQSLNETVNPANGAVSIRVLAPTPKERGIDFPLYAYVYDSNGQYYLDPSFGFVPADNMYHLSSVSLSSIPTGGGGGNRGGSVLTGARDNSDAPGTVAVQSITLSQPAGSSGGTVTCVYNTILRTSTLSSRPTE